MWARANCLLLLANAGLLLGPTHQECGGVLFYNTSRGTLQYFLPLSDPISGASYSCVLPDNVEAIQLEVVSQQSKSWADVRCNSTCLEIKLEATGHEREFCGLFWSVPEAGRKLVIRGQGPGVIVLETSASGFKHGLTLRYLGNLSRGIDSNAPETLTTIPVLSPAPGKQDVSQHEGLTVSPASMGQVQRIAPGNSANEQTSRGPAWIQHSSQISEGPNLLLHPILGNLSYPDSGGSSAVRDAQTEPLPKSTERMNSSGESTASVNSTSNRPPMHRSSAELLPTSSNQHNSASIPRSGSVSRHHLSPSSLPEPITSNNPATILSSKYVSTSGQRSISTSRSSLVLRPSIQSFVFSPKVNARQSLAPSLAPSADPQLENLDGVMIQSTDRVGSHPAPDSVSRKEPRLPDSWMVGRSRLTTAQDDAGSRSDTKERLGRTRSDRWKTHPATSWPPTTSLSHETDQAPSSQSVGLISLATSSDLRISQWGGRQQRSSQWPPSPLLEDWFSEGGEGRLLPGSQTPRLLVTSPIPIWDPSLHTRSPASEGEATVSLDFDYVNGIERTGDPEPIQRQEFPATSSQPITPSEQRKGQSSSGKRMASLSQTSRIPTLSTQDSNARYLSSYPPQTSATVTHFEGMQRKYHDKDISSTAPHTVTKAGPWNVFDIRKLMSHSSKLRMQGVSNGNRTDAGLRRASYPSPSAQPAGIPSTVPALSDGETTRTAPSRSAGMDGRASATPSASSPSFELVKLTNAEVASGDWAKTGDRWLTTVEASENTHRPDQRLAIAPRVKPNLGFLVTSTLSFMDKDRSRSESTAGSSTGSTLRAELLGEALQLEGGSSSPSNSNQEKSAESRPMITVVPGARILSSSSTEPALSQPPANGNLQPTEVDLTEIPASKMDHHTEERLSAAPTTAWFPWRSSVLPNSRPPAQITMSRAWSSGGKATSSAESSASANSREVTEVRQSEFAPKTREFSERVQPGTKFQPIVTNLAQSQLGLQTTSQPPIERRGAMSWQTAGSSFSVWSEEPTPPTTISFEVNHLKPSSEQGPMTSDESIMSWTHQLRPETKDLSSKPHVINTEDLDALPTLSARPSLIEQWFRNILPNLTNRTTSVTEIDLVTVTAHPGRVPTSGPESVTSLSSALVMAEFVTTHHTPSTSTLSNDISRVWNTDVSQTQSTDVSQTQSTDISQTQSTDISQTQSTDVSQTQSTDISQTQSTDVSQTQSTDVSQTQSTDVSQTQSTDVSQTQSTDISQTQSTDISQTQSTDISQTQSTDVSQTQSTDISQTQSTDVSQTQSTDVSQTQSTDVSQTQSTDISQTWSTDTGWKLSTKVSQIPNTDISHTQSLTLSQTRSPNNSWTRSPDISWTLGPVISWTQDPDIRQTRGQVVSQTLGSDIRQTWGSDIRQTRGRDIRQTRDRDNRQTRGPGIRQTGGRVVSQSQNPDISQTQSTDVSQTQSTDISQTQSTDISQTQSTDVSQTQSTDISQTQGTDISQTQGTDVSQTQSTDVSETQSTDASQTQSTDISQTQSTDISQTQGTDVSQTQGTDVCQTQSTDVSQTQSTDISQTQSTDISQTWSTDTGWKLSTKVSQIPNTDISHTQSLALSQTRSRNNSWTRSPDISRTLGPGIRQTRGPDTRQTRGPDIRQTWGPGIRQTQDPVISQTLGPGIKQTGSPDIRQTQDPVISQTLGPDISQTRGPDISQTLGPGIRQTGSPVIRQIQDPDISQTLGPGIRQTGSPVIRQTRGPDIRQTQDPVISQTLGPGIRQTGSPGIRQTGNPDIGQTRGPDIRQTQDPVVSQTLGPDINQTWGPDISQTWGPVISQTWGPGIRQTGSPDIRQTGSPDIRQTQDPVVSQTLGPGIRQTGSPGIRQTGSPDIRQTGSPDIRQTQDPVVSQTLGPDISQTRDPDISQTLGPGISQTLGPGIRQTGSPDIRQTQDPVVSQTLGPDISQTRDPDISQTLGPGISQTLGPGIRQTGSPDISQTLGPGIRQTQDPDISQTLGPDISQTLGPGIRQTLGPGIRQTRSPDISQTWGPDIRQTLGPGIRQTLGPGIRQTQDPVISQTLGPGIKQTGSPVIRQTQDPVISQTLGPDIRQTRSPDIRQTRGPVDSQTLGPEVSQTQGQDVSWTRGSDIGQTRSTGIIWTLSPVVSQTQTKDISQTVNSDISQMWDTSVSQKWETSINQTQGTDVSQTGTTGVIGSLDPVASWAGDWDVSQTWSAGTTRTLSLGHTRSAGLSQSLDPDISRTPGPDISQTQGEGISRTLGPDGRWTWGQDVSWTPGPDISQTWILDISRTWNTDISQLQNTDISHTLGPDISQTLGPDISHTLSPDVSQTQSLDISQTGGLDIRWTWGMDISQTLGLDVSQTLGPDISQTLGPDVSQTQSTDISQLQNTDIIQILGPDISQTRGADVSWTGSLEVSQTQGMDVSWTGGLEVNHTWNRFGTAVRLPTPSTGSVAFLLPTSRPSTVGLTSTAADRDTGRTVQSTSRQLPPGARRPTGNTISLSTPPMGRKQIFIVEDQLPLVREGVTVKIPTKLILDMSFNLHLKDSKSEEYQKLAKDFALKISPFYDKIPGFQQLQIKRFSAGTVKIEFDAIFGLTKIESFLLEPDLIFNVTGLWLVISGGLEIGGARVVTVYVTEKVIALCGEVLFCQKGFQCVHSKSGNVSCTSLCHTAYCKNNGICTHNRGQAPMCQCPVGSDYWFMGPRCDHRMTNQTLIAIAFGVVFALLVVLAAVAFAVLRRFKVVLTEAKIDQTRSSYKRFSRFDDFSNQHQSQSWLSFSVNSLDNPGFSNSDELIHLQILDTSFYSCYEESVTGTYSSQRTGPHGQPTFRHSLQNLDASINSINEYMGDSGKASDLSVCSWPGEPPRWSPFPILYQLGRERPFKASRPHSYYEGMELVSMERNWTA